MRSGSRSPALSLGRAAEIFVPRGTDPAKIDALERFGSAIRTRVVDGSYDDTERAARYAAERPGTAFVSSYNDPLVIAGQSTVGAEALAQWPHADAVIVPVGGGGLLSGVALACADHRAPVAAWGVEPQYSPAMSASLRAGTDRRHRRRCAIGRAGPGRQSRPRQRHLSPRARLRCGRAGHERRGRCSPPSRASTSTTRWSSSPRAARRCAASRV